MPCPILHVPIKRLIWRNGNYHSERSCIEVCKRMGCRLGCTLKKKGDCPLFLCGLVLPLIRCCILLCCSVFTFCRSEFRSENHETETPPLPRAHIEWVRRNQICESEPAHCGWQPQPSNDSSEYIRMGAKSWRLLASATCNSCRGAGGCRRFQRFCSQRCLDDSENEKWPGATLFSGTPLRRWQAAI